MKLVKPPTSKWTSTWNATSTAILRRRSRKTATLSFLALITTIASSWRKERSAGMPNMKYDTEIWNSQKYLIEATIPEMSICTDCILSRLTIINVEQADLGNYYINATVPEYPSEFGKITLYRKSNSPVRSRTITPFASFRNARLSTIHHSSR